MKNKIFVLAIISFVVLQGPVYASTPSYMAGQADRVTMFNKVTDFFATVGKPDAEKNRLLRERKLSRRMERIQKERLKNRMQNFKNSRR